MEESTCCSRREFLAGLAPAAVSSGSRRADDWDGIRGAFRLPDDLVFMNNGSLGAAPGCVFEAVAGAWRRLSRDPVAEGFGPLLEEAEAARVRAASFLGCSPGELAVTRNTTEGMNMAAQGIGLGPGDRVLTTDQEHAGGRVCWEYYATHHGVVIDKVSLPVPPAPSANITRLFEEKMTDQTRVISVSHVTYTTGHRLPVAKIARLASAAGALLVADGAQAPGGIQVDVRALGCDVYATSAHKWMLAPPGSGLLYIREQVRERVRPVSLHHGYGVYTAATGTRDAPSIIGLGAAVEFLQQLGMPEVEARNMQLRDRLYHGLREIPGARVVSPSAETMSAPLVTLAIPDHISNADLARALRRNHGIEVKVLTHNLLRGIRLSTHVYNRQSDIDRVLRALRVELA